MRIVCGYALIWISIISTNVLWGNNYLTEISSFKLFLIHFNLESQQKKNVSVFLYKKMWILSKFNNNKKLADVFIRKSFLCNFGKIVVNASSLRFFDLDLQQWTGSQYSSIPLFEKQRPAAGIKIIKREVKVWRYYMRAISKNIHFTFIGQGIYYILFKKEQKKNIYIK